jgi:hypothetical protein
VYGERDWRAVSQPVAELHCPRQSGIAYTQARIADEAEAANTAEEVEEAEAKARNVVRAHYVEC